MTASAAPGAGLARAHPYLGHGVGLRVQHYARALAGALEVDWVEVITENFFGGGGRPRAVLEAVRRERPLVFHGVSLGVGSWGPPDVAYLRQVKALADAFEPAWLSDHVCWTRCDGRQSHELLPLPLTREALELAIDNTQRAQEFLGRPLVLENVSSYVAYRGSELREWEFLAELAQRSGCSLLLDLNNVLVSAHNHGFAPGEYLMGLPASKVVQFHLANHSHFERYKFDDHRGPVPPAVWQLYESALRRFGAVSSLIEWDEDLPAWQLLVAERHQAALRAEVALAEAPSAARPLEPSGEPASREQTSRPAAHVGARAPALESTQRLFFQALTWPRGVRDFARVAGDDAGRELEQTFEGGSGWPVVERLDIYANAYFYRLLDALRELCPRLAELAGEVPFHNFVTDYLLECPPTRPDLRRLGDRLPEFLRGHALARRDPALRDLARLELSLARALDAPDVSLWTRAELARQAPEEWPALALALAPSTELLRVAHDLDRWLPRSDATAREPGLGIASSEPTLELLVGRRGHAVYHRALDPCEALALASVRGGVRFDALCEDLAQRGVEPATLLALLQRWVDDEVLERQI